MKADVESAAYLARAKESLAGAVSEHGQERYNNAVNRAYYSCFQAAIAALLRSGIRPASSQSGWGHGFVQAQFVEQLIRRRKQYPAEFSDVLVRLFALRRAADCRFDPVSHIQAPRALRRAESFVAAVEAQEGDSR